MKKTEEYFQNELARLQYEHRTIMEDIDSHKYPFDIFKEKMDSAFEVLKQMNKLDSEHKEFLLEQLDKAGISMIQNIINKIFGLES